MSLFFSFFAFCQLFFIKLRKKMKRYQDLWSAMCYFCSKHATILQHLVNQSNFHLNFFFHWEKWVSFSEKSDFSEKRTEIQDFQSLVESQILEINRRRFSSNWVAGLFWNNSEFYSKKVSKLDFNSTTASKNSVFFKKELKKMENEHQDEVLSKKNLFSRQTEYNSIQNLWYCFHQAPIVAMMCLRAILGKCHLHHHHQSGSLL